MPSSDEPSLPSGPEGAAPASAGPGRRGRRTRAPARSREAVRGKVRPHDPFELIRWLALSQPDPRKALAELVQNSLDAGASRRRGCRTGMTISDDPSKTLDLDRDLPTSRDDAQALRRAKALAPLDLSGYLRFLAQVPSAPRSPRRERNTRPDQPFDLTRAW